MSVTYIQKTLKPVAKKAYKYNALIKLNQMRSIENPAVNKISDAIYDVLKDNLDSDEKKWVNLLEEKRRILYNDSTPISITDYGVNSQNSVADDVMHQEVITTSTIGEKSRNASKPYLWSLLLFKLIRKFKPLNCIELGTCLGVSGSYQAAALKINNKGNFVTLEGSEALAFHAKTYFQKLSLDNINIVCGRFIDTLDKVLAENQPIDYAFIDGHHDEQATLFYLEKFLPYLSKNAVLVFDDISWSEGMRHAWEKIEQHKAIKISVNLRAMGIAVIDGTQNKYNFKIPLV